MKEAATAPTAAPSSGRPAAGSRRAAILAAAGAAFGERGYHATSMRDLAASLDLQGASLYAHISAKEELLLEIVDAAADAFLAVADGLDPALAPRERLRAMVGGHLAVIAEKLQSATVFFDEWKHLSGPARARVVEKRDRYQAALRAIVEEGAATGAFLVADAHLATLLVLSTLNWTYRWYDPAGRLSLGELTDGICAYIEGALGAERPQAEGAGR